MLRIFGEPCIGGVRTSKAESIELNISDIFRTNIDESIMDGVRKKYEGKTIKDCYILKINKLLGTKEDRHIYLNYSNNKGQYVCYVMFEAYVETYERGDIIVGAVCEVPGVGDSEVSLRKGKLILTGKLSNNLGQLSKGQVITCSLIKPVWTPFSQDIRGRCIFSHSGVKPNVVYKVNVKEIGELKKYIEKFKIKEIKGDEKNTYPFSVDKSKTYKFDTITLQEILENKKEEDYFIMDSSFLNPSKFYLCDEPKIWEKDISTYDIITSLLESYIKYSNVVEETAKLDLKKKGFLSKYYEASKLNNDKLEDVIMNSYVVG